MKKQLSQSFVALLILTASFWSLNVMAQQQTVTCQSDTANISVTTPTGNPPSSYPTQATIAWSTTCYDEQVSVTDQYVTFEPQNGPANGSIIVNINKPEEIYLRGYQFDPVCPIDTPDQRASCSLADPWTLATSLLPVPTATVTVNNTCTNGTWTSSTGDTSSPFTITDPTADGTTVTITLSPPSGYAAVYDPSSSQLVTRGSSKTFGLSCTRITITPTLTASSSPYTCGGNTTLTWGQDTTEATSCSAGRTSSTNSASWTSSTNTSGTQVVSPTDNPHVYGITCYGANSSSGYTSISIPMVAGSCSRASVDVSANPTSISSGGSSTISWTGTNVSSCSGSPWTTKTTASDSQLVTNILSTTNFPMSCTSSVGGTNPSGSATVTVVAANSKPVVTITANPTSGTVDVVNPLLTWSATGSPTYCAASGDWSGTKSSPGSAYQGTLSSVKTYTYTLACHNTYGTSTPASATVVVSAAPVVNGSCGTTPSHWVCATGTSANNAGTGPWTWSCIGSGTGHTDASCSQAVGGFTYSLSKGNATVNVNKGSTVTNTITRTAGTGTQGSVTLGATVLPPDLSISFSSQSCIPTCTSIATIGANNNATLGVHTVTVEGTPASSNGAVSFTVNVNAGSSPVVSCSPSSSSALVGQPVTWSANVSGGTPPYTYVWSGTNVPTAPAPTHSSSNTTDTYSNTYTTTGLKHATVRVTDSASNFGDCTNGGYPGSDVQINFNPTFQEF